MPSWEQAVETVESHQHLLQLYEADEQVLIGNVGNYLADGLKRGEGLLVIATAAHSEAFLGRLEAAGGAPRAALRNGRLVMLDAEATLSGIMTAGNPDRDRFESTVGSPVRQLRARADLSGLRAYGELVALLWKSEQFPAAIRVEELWNELLRAVGFNLFCAYPIDVFGKGFQDGAVEGILRAHTHLISSGVNGGLDIAVNRAIDELVGPKAGELRSRSGLDSHASGVAMPAAEADILWLRRALPEYAEEVLSRARQHYKTEKRFRALIENSSDAICLMDAQGKVLYASASTARVLGYEPEELVGRNGLELIHPEDVGDVGRTFQESLQRPRAPLHVQARVRGKHGRWRWVESSCANLLDEPDVRSIVLNFRDIGERKAAEEERQRDADELARSNAELQAFAYAATHDLKEPLRTICSFTQLLVQKAQLDAAGKEYAAFIVDGVKRMTVLLDDLLSFNSLSFADSRRRVELRAAVDQALQNLDHAMRESAASIVVGPLPSVYGNESHLVLLFQNLIGNAIKYRGEAPLRIHVTAEKLQREWVVRIKDNGIGIPPEYHDRVFGLFKRLHSRDVPGTGIGLAICKKIVERMEGRIWVESEAGQGSVFCFTVPVAA